MAAQGLPCGQLGYEVLDPASGKQQAVLDMAWPGGIQEGLSQPVAVLLNEPTATLACASQVGFRCFTATHDFRCHVEQEILG